MMSAGQLTPQLQVSLWIADSSRLEDFQSPGWIPWFPPDPGARIVCFPRRRSCLKEKQTRKTKDKAIWLLVWTYPSEKYESQFGWLFPVYEKKMFQTTNQQWDGMLCGSLILRHSHFTSFYDMFTIPIPQCHGMKISHGGRVFLVTTRSCWQRRCRSRCWCEILSSSSGSPLDPQWC